MLYQVIFHLAGEERTASIDAVDAASAVSQTQVEFGLGGDMFELISVMVVNPSPEDQPTESDDATDPA